ncbi:MAG: PEP-CTERM sorting domain-containing protein [Acidobacteria bacterium]|nr:PEP-CTERM sorting domain-containing protein [Acidobacteriota bacterium]
MKKLTNTFGLLLPLLTIAVGQLDAALYISRLNSTGNPFGYTSSYYQQQTTPPASSTTPTTTTTTSTLQTSSCLYNACGGSAPGTTPTSNTTTSFAPTQSSNVYRSTSFSGAVSRYSVFGLYTFSPTAFGQMQQPVFSGGLTPQTVMPPTATATNPEPTSVALFGAGLLALGWASRRRKQRQS